MVRPHESAPAAPAGWRREAFVDFGPPETAARGATGIDGHHRQGWVAWSGGMIRTVLRRDRPDPLLADVAEGEDATLVLGAVPGVRYRVVLTLGDPLAERGPMDVWVDGRPAASGVRTGAGEAVDLELAARAATGRLRIHLKAADCGAFAVCGVAVYVPEEAAGGGLPDLWPPTVATGQAAPRPPGAPGVRARRTLRTYANYLLAERPAEGCFSYRGSWYESAFPIRTLLLAATLLREPRYREAAFACLDRFVREQGPDGTWSATYFGKAGCDLARAARDTTWARNLADVGCMALCLPLAAERAGRTRRAAYLEAARRFADAVVLPNQLDSGAFPNLTYAGTEFRHPYSVATGVQAASLSALYAVTGERRYLAAAERAARFLAAGFEDTRTIRFWPHGSNAARKESPGQLGDLFYILEGLLWVEHYGSPGVRDAIRPALARYFGHDRGLATWPEAATWLTAGGHPWENSKRPGLLYLLAGYGMLPDGNTALTRRWRDDLLRALQDPSRLEGGEILADPDGPRGTYALAATGFAGMGIAACIRPGALYPGRGPRWRRP